MGDLHGFKSRVQSINLTVPNLEHKHISLYVTSIRTENIVRNSNVQCAYTQFAAFITTIAIDAGKSIFLRVIKM